MAEIQLSEEVRSALDRIDWSALEVPRSVVEANPKVAEQLAAGKATDLVTYSVQIPGIPEPTEKTVQLVSRRMKDEASGEWVLDPRVGVREMNEDYRLRNAISSRSHKAAKEEPVFEDNTGDLTVDLHIERVPGSDGIPEWAALDFQMNYFRQVLRKNLKHRGRHIIFIHGVGDGILAAALRKELDEVFALSCTYTFGPMGVTNVTIR